MAKTNETDSNIPGSTGPVGDGNYEVDQGESVSSIVSDTGQKTRLSNNPGGMILMPYCRAICCISRNVNKKKKIVRLTQSGDLKSLVQLLYFEWLLRTMMAPEQERIT